MSKEFYVGNEKGDYLGDKWVASPLGLSGGAWSPNSTVNQPGGRKTLQGNGGQFFYYLPLNWLIQRTLSAPLAEIYGQFGLLIPAPSGGPASIFQFYLASGGTPGPIGWIAMENQGGGNVQLYFYRGDGTQLASSISTFQVSSAWVLVEWHIAPSASGGVFEMWVNGALQIQILSGNITGSSGQNTIDTIIMGCPNQLTWYDDVICNNTSGTFNNGRSNGSYVIPQFAVGPGNSSQLINSYGNSQSNFQFVNSVPSLRPNLGYVGTNTPGKKDTYQMPPMPLEFVGVNAARVSALLTQNGPAVTHVQGVLIPNAVIPGSVAVSASVNVVGTGTTFTSQLANGDKISFASQPGVTYTINTITDDTHLSLTVAYSGTPSSNTTVGEAEIDTPTSPGSTIPNGGFGWVEAGIELDSNTGQPLTANAVNNMQAGIIINA